MTDLAGDATVAVAQAAAAGSAPALDAAPGIVATEDERYNATLVRRVDQHERHGEEHRENRRQDQWRCPVRTHRV